MFRIELIALSLNHTRRGREKVDRYFREQVTSISAAQRFPALGFRGPILRLKEVIELLVRASDTIKCVYNSEYP